MARFLKPLVRSGGYYPSRRWTPLVYPGGYTTANGGEEPAPPPIEKTITGNPIHILDALAKPAQALSVKLEPVQDLHGYDSPWPAGGGVNLLDPAKCSALGPTAAYGLTVTHDQATAIWTISGTPTLQNASLAFNFCTYSDFSLSGKGYQIQAFPISGTPIKNLYGFRNEAENRIAIIIDTVANPTVNMKFKVSVAATAQTAWSPYSNICPISGWTGANIANISDSTMQLYFAGLLNGDCGFVDLGTLDWTYNNATSTPIFSIKVEDINAKPNSSDFICLGYTSKLRFWTEANNDKCIGSGNSNFNISNFAYNDAITFKSAMSGVYLIYKNKTPTAPTITPTQYNTLLSSFNVSGWLVPISWQTAAGTVYGGTLDVTTGKLTVDRAMVDLGAKNWYPSTAAGRTRFRTSITDIERISSPNVRASLLCSNYPTKTANQTYQGITGVSLQQNEADIYIYDPQTESMTTAEFKSAMSGVQLCYKLATPIVYDLTPTEVTLLLGENNIWSDGEMTLTYLADGNASDEEALNILFGGRYVNNHSEDEPTDREALNIVLGGNER